METKGKGKAIIGIAMAVIMVASVFAAMVPTVSAAESEHKIDATRPVSEINGTAMFFGETVNITGLNYSTRPTVTFDQVAEPYESHVISVTEVSNNNSYARDEITSSDFGGETGKFIMTYGTGTGELKAEVYIKEPTLSVKIVNAAGKEITSATKGDPIYLKVDTNLPDEDIVTLKAMKTSTEEIDVLELGDVPDYMIDTGDWDVGDYDIWLELEEDESRGLSKSECPCTPDTITILESEITIEADTTEPVKYEEVTFTINGPSSTLFDFETNKPEYVMMTRLEDNPLGLLPGEKEKKMSEEGGTFTVKTDKNGVYKFVAYFTDDKKFTFKVWFDAASYDDATGKHKDDVDIDVSEQKVAFEVDRTVIRGEEVTIKGTAPEADWVVIAVDDDVIEGGEDVTVTDGEFEIDWDTTDYMTGTYTIEGFIKLYKDEATKTKYTEGEDVSGESSDGHASIKVISKGLTVEQPRNVVAIKDDYTVKGTATGVDNVDILIIGPKGCHGENCLGDNLDKAVEGGFAHTTGSVTDSEFEEDITIPDDSKTGLYTVLVLIPGDDGDWGASYGTYGEGDLDVLLRDDGLANLDEKAKGKTLGQLLSLVSSYTFDDTATDDLYETLTFSAESAYVRFNPAESVGVGEPLNMSGITNRYDTSITVSTISGPVDLPAEIVDVEWPTAEEGVFSVTIDTSDAEEGTYVLEADDGDDNTDTVTVVIGAAAPEPTPTPEPTAEPTAAPTAIPTAVPTAEPTATPTATPTPGFEAVFAIAGMLAIAYLVLRKRRE